MIDSSVSAKVEELLRFGLSPLKARHTLDAAGYDRETVMIAMVEYEQRFETLKARQRRITQLFGWLVFLGCGSLFVWMFESRGVSLVSGGFLGLSVFGLLLGLMPQFTR